MCVCERESVCVRDSERECVCVCGARMRACMHARV